METPFLPFAAYYWYLSLTVYHYDRVGVMVHWKRLYLPKAPSLTLESIDVHVSFSGFYWKVALQNLLFFLGSAQMSNLWDNLWKIIKIIFFRKWLSTGSLDTHLAQSLILPSLVQTSIHFLTVKELCIIVCQLGVCITWCVFLFFPDRKLRKV